MQNYVLVILFHNFAIYLLAYLCNILYILHLSLSLSADYKLLLKRQRHSLSVASA